jgi:hypothetical protein
MHFPVLRFSLMQVDSAVELGRDDEVLEFPWAAPDGASVYHDLKRHPELLLYIDEANRVLELGQFLGSVNAPDSLFETAKCDVWSSTHMNPEEKIFGARWKFASYVDLLFTSEPSRFSFPEHEQFLKRITELLKRVPEIPASAEFLLRRCYFRQSGTDTRDGFYVTFYLFGYGDDEMSARQQWAIGMKLAEHTIWQISAGSEEKSSPVL